MLLSRRIALASFLAIAGTSGTIFANPIPPDFKIPTQPLLKPQPMEITAELGHALPKADQSMILSASLTNKDGSRPAKGFKIKLSAGDYSCDAEVGNVAGVAMCAVKIPFAKINSDGTKFYNVGRIFTINAAIPPSMGTLTVKDTPNRKFTLLSKEGYDLKVFPASFVGQIILPSINDSMPAGILLNNYKGGKNPLFLNASWIYLDKKDATKAINFHYPEISVTDKYGINLLTAKFYTNRLYIQPNPVTINNTNGTFDLTFNMTGFDGSGPSIVGLCQEFFCPDAFVPDFKNLRFDEARASYKLGVVNGKFKVSLVDSKIRLNFNCSGGFVLICDQFRDKVNGKLPSHFQAQLQSPVIFAQIEKSANQMIGALVKGKLADFQICSPNRADCNQGDMLVFYVPEGK